jgi:hypothetical protein
VATTRAQRRRRSVLVSIIVIVVLLAVVFARDINRSAHQSSSPRRSENKSFAALAKVLITQENQFDERLNYLLTNGTGLSRVDFGARLTQFDGELLGWLDQAHDLSSPVLAHHVNVTLATITTQRVDDFQTLLTHVAIALALPWTASTPLEVGLSTTDAQASLVSTNTTWNVARWSLVKEPGRVTLPATSDVVGVLDLGSVLDALEHSSTLAITRSISISAVLVSPASLPAPTGELLFPPAREIRLGVTVTNLDYVLQPITMTYSFRQTNGARAVQTQTMVATLRPLGSYAFVPKLLVTTAGERATLDIRVTGTPNDASLSIARHYLVIVSPSGNS